MRMLPQFPLQLVVFPDENLNLHIFEPRYRQLILECAENGTTFGIPAFIDGKVQDIGTEVELVNIEKTFASGEMDVKTRGIGIFRIEEFYNRAPNKLYAAAEVNFIEIKFETELILRNQVISKLRELYELLNVEKQLPDNPDDFMVYDWAHHMGCNLNQEYDILRIPDEIGRLEFCETHLNNLLPIVRETEMLRQKAKMNGHFKNVLPPDFE